MATLLQDLRYGARMLLRRPGFSAVVVLVLTLGIGANSAIFSVVYSVLLRPLPYAEPERLYHLMEVNPKGEPSGIPPSDAETFLRHTAAYDRLGLSHWENGTLTGAEGAENIYGARVSADLFPTLGVQPALGRVFRGEEFRPGAAGVVILSDRLWRHRFGGGAGVIGRQLMLNGQAYTIIGVAPADFIYDRRYEYWIPWHLTAADTASRENTAVAVARLKKGVTPERARAETEAVLRNTAPEDFAKGWRVRLTSVHEQITSRSRPTLLTLLGAVGFVLLLACLNVANLLIARGADRGHEMAIRAALGAGQLRAVRQMLTESLLLALLGGLFGLAAGWWGAKAMMEFFPEGSPMLRLEQTRMNFAVLGFTFLLTLATGLFFGLFPAIQAGNTNLQSALKSGTRTAGGSRRLRLVRDALIVGQTALSVVLLAGAGLMLRSFGKLMSTDAGFRPEHVLTLRVPIPVKIKEKPQQQAHYVRLIEQMRSMPGLLGAGLIAPLPLAGVDARATFAVEGRPQRTEDRELVKLRTATPGYFQAMGLQLVKGRVFEESDTPERDQVAVISEALVKRYFADTEPLGRRVTMSAEGKGPWLTVVGVIRDVKPISLSDKAAPEMYRPLRQFIFSTFATTLVLRIAGDDPTALAAAVQRQIRTFDAEQPVNDVLPMEEVVARSAAQPRFRTVLLGLFAAIAVALAGAGLYGVLSYTVSQKVREIGIRAALGASRGVLVGTVVGHAMKVVMAGMAIGLAGSYFLTKLIETQLYQVGTADPLTYLSVCVVLAIVALAAALGPARRAVRIDPITALRCE